eukprot:g28.t1
MEREAKRPRPCADAQSAAAQLRALLAKAKCYQVPCCSDALGAKLIQRAGFEICFMSGFCVAAVHGHPDTQLIAGGEMSTQLTDICTTTTLPVIGDGDNGYGNAVNVKHTVRRYARAGAACIMIEDQVQPKRCGHTRGKGVVSRAEAVARVRAAADARDEGADILVMARTDARGTHGIDEAIARCVEFRAAGADVTFLEAPLSEAEMERYCREVSGPKMANMIEGGKTPVLPLSRLQAMGFNIAVYPITLLSAAIKAMDAALQLLRQEKPADPLLCEFEHVKDVVGFNKYYEEEERYKAGHEGSGSAE